jgi:hypothetical protein
MRLLDRGADMPTNGASGLFLVSAEEQLAFNIGLKYLVPTYPGECLPFVLK